MTKMMVANKEMELKVEGKAAEKAKERNVTEEMMKDILQRNEETIQDANENEEVLIVGNVTLAIFKTSEKVVVTNLFGQQNIF